MKDKIKERKEMLDRLPLNSSATAHAILTSEIGLAAVEFESELIAYVEKLEAKNKILRERVRSLENDNEVLRSSLSAHYQQALSQCDEMEGE